MVMIFKIFVVLDSFESPPMKALVGLELIILLLSLPNAGIYRYGAPHSINGYFLISN